MEFKFNVNDILPDPISVVDEKLLPFARRQRFDRVTLASKQADLKKIIDLMGEASTKAQNLKTPITSAIKLLHSDHKLYISKDPNANNGLGAVVGIIKIGHKKLFVQDFQGVQYEVNPLCILDFYVHESRQRTGCGKTLFDHMLKMEGVNVDQLAIDKPSHKFLSFLKKHFHLDKPIPQVNNFVIYAGFFHDLQAVGLVPKRGHRFSSPSSGQAPVHPYKRQTNENNEHLINKRQAMNCQSPLNKPSSLQQDEQETTIEVEPMETSSSYLSSSAAIPTSTDQTYKDISLPPIVSRPPGRHSASRAQGGPSGTRWVLDNSLAGGAATYSAFNAERGLAARATAYSRYNPSRENSAPVIRTNRDSARSNLDNFDRISSGGRKRNLHLTSAGNPLQTESFQRQKPALNKKQPTEVKPQMDVNSNESTNSSVNPNYLTSTGNYSISQMYNSLYGPQRSLGTGWNVFGVPTGTGMLQTRRNSSRTFPY